MLTTVCRLPERAAQLPRCQDEICWMNYYSGGILFINRLLEVPNVPTVAVPFRGLYRFRQGQITTAFTAAFSRFQDNVHLPARCESPLVEN